MKKHYSNPFHIAVACMLCLKLVDAISWGWGWVFLCAIWLELLGND